MEQALNSSEQKQENEECNVKGHDFEIYEYSTGHWSNDVEMAGHCTRCGFDTHAD